MNSLMIAAYENANFMGRRTLVESEYPDFADLAFNDIVSAVKIYDGPINGKLMLFTGANFSGKHTLIVDDICDFKAVLGPAFNDHIRSVTLEAAESTQGVAAFYRNKDYDSLETIVFQGSYDPGTEQPWSSVQLISFEEATALATKTGVRQVGQLS